MSEYIKHNNTITFHPGYYIKEIIVDKGLSQEDFAKRLGTSPKNLSILIRGEQSLSADIALKLSKMLGTSMTYWQNLQNAYDVATAEVQEQAAIVQEKAVFKNIGYSYFRDNFGLADHSRNLNEQVKAVRTFLGISSLCILQNPDVAISFRSEGAKLDDKQLVRANAMVQIAVNQALEADCAVFDRAKFASVAERALDFTAGDSGSISAVKELFAQAGVALVVLPNLPGSHVNGATKKIGKSILLFVNDRRASADTFWFTLYHEIGHILNGDYGISLEKDSGEREKRADDYARSALVPEAPYKRFLEERDGDRIKAADIEAFSKLINRSPAIVLGRLQKDGFVAFNDLSVARFRQKISFSMA